MPFARLVWTPYKPPTPGIPACQWVWQISPKSCGTTISNTTLETRSGLIAIDSCCRTATGRCCCTVLLHLSGYPLGIDEIRNFRQFGQRTAGHPEREPELGIETTTGPLGQGISNAVGMALAEKMLAATFNRGKIQYRRPPHMGVPWRRMPDGRHLS